MKHRQQVTEILELILETGCDPEVACAQAPELLPEILERMQQVRRVEQQLNQLFPDSKVSPTESSLSAEPKRASPSHFPKIPGYALEGLLGSGGMGVVYKARHLKLNRVVALKMLRTGHFATPNEVIRFAREFQAIAELQCIHVVQIYDVGDIDGCPYYTMEYVDGGSLAEQLRGIPQPARRSAELVAKLAEAIDSAHRRGIIHRDLKPANILLSQDGCPKIADFGLARHMVCDQPLTMSGVQMGTPSYMAPEQTNSSPDSAGPAADVYALGAILYEMLTGRPPFRAETALETLRQVSLVDPLSPARVNASVPRDLETICLCCLKKDPQQRYHSALALAQDLTRFLQHQPIQARPTGRTERALRWMQRNPALTGLSCTALALSALAVAFAWREMAASEREQVEAEKWRQRLEFVMNLEQQGRFTEARAILGRVPDGGSKDLRERIQLAQSQLELAEHLDAIRISRGNFKQGGGIDYAEPCRLYEAAFRQAGIGSPGDNVSQVAERIQGSTVRLALIAALDDWATCAESNPRAWILNVARQADPDPWRDRVRDESNWANTKHLEELADSVQIEEQPVTILVAMGTRWRRLGGNPWKYLQRVHHQYPGDFWLNFELGMVNDASQPHAADLAIALAHNMAALAVRPNAASIHFNCGTAYSRLDQPDQASYHFSRVLQLDPTHTWAEYRLAIVLFNSGNSEDAIEHFRRALQLDHEYKDAKNGLRIALIKLGQLEEAATVWDATLSDKTASHQDVDGLGELFLYLNRENDYHRVCEEMLDRYGATSNPFICERLGRTCLLKPDSAEMTQKAMALIDRAFDAELPAHEQWARPYIVLAKALCDYRQGDFASTLTRLEGQTALEPIPDLLMAMALHRLNRTTESREALDRAQKQLDEPKQANNREAWLTEIIRREAFSTISIGK